jgi:hypothetical protein
MQVADAPKHAHSQGVLHRDIKPSNLLLDSAGTVWVTDFGLAKAEDRENLTHTGDIVGMLRYMPPEAFNGQATARSDIYSLGLTLYELLALRPAFDEPDRTRLVKQVVTDGPPRLSSRGVAIPRELVTIIQKAIERDPARRYATAGEMAADLRRFLNDEAIHPRRASPLEQLALWGRRHPAVAILLGVITVLLVGVAVAATIVAWRFERLAGEKEMARVATEEARQGAEAAPAEARRRHDDERWECYRTNLAAAAAALQLQSSAAAARALEAAPQEHRNWEWRHFNSQLDGARQVLPIPAGNIRTLAMSPLVRQIAVCGSGGTDVYLCDMVAGRLEAVLHGHSADVATIAYRPDGKQLATGGYDKTIRL